MDSPTAQLTIIQPAATDVAVRRELALAAWLAEKAGLSHSRETERAYDAIMDRFRAALAPDRSRPGGAR